VRSSNASPRDFRRFRTFLPDRQKSLAILLEVWKSPAQQKPSREVSGAVPLGVKGRPACNAEETYSERWRQDEARTPTLVFDLRSTGAFPEGLVDVPLAAKSPQGEGKDIGRQLRGSEAHADQNVRA